MLQIEIITDLDTEPVSLIEAKSFLGMSDISDFDTLITLLITASRKASERVTGKAYGPKVVQVTGNRTNEDRTTIPRYYSGLLTDITYSSCIERIYPITPYVSAVTDWEDENGNIDYRYNAGFTTCPEDLKLAILARTATDFVMRQGSTDMTVNPVWSAYIEKERNYVTQFLA